MIKNKPKNNSKKNKNKFFNNFLLWAIIIGVVLLVVSYMDSSNGAEKINFSDFQKIIRTEVKKSSSMMPGANMTEEECLYVSNYIWQDKCYESNHNIIRLLKMGMF